MTGHRWKRAAALLLAGGMLLSQGGYVYAAEPESAEEMTMLYALDASGTSVQISEAVYAMINDGLYIWMRPAGIWSGQLTGSGQIR